MIAIHSDFSSVSCCHITQSSIFLSLLVLITAESLFQLVINTQNFLLSYSFSDFVNRLLNKLLCLSSKQFLESSHFFSHSFISHELRMMSESSQSFHCSFQNQSAF